MGWHDFQHHIQRFPAKEQNNIEKAFLLGEKLHEGQKRLSGDPYFSHPAAVATMLAGMGADADTLIAALLHDTVEDTPYTLRDVDRDFDGQVAALIEGVTKLSAAELEQKPNLNEQAESLRKMFTLMEKDIRIMVIKLVDRLHNMRTAQYLPEDKRHALAQETLDVYVKIADRLSMQDLRYELESLCLSVLHPDLYRQLLQLREDGEHKALNVLPALRDTVARVYPDLVEKTAISFEPKAWHKLRAQLESKGTVVTGLSSLTFVFVCPDRESCYRVLGALHEFWRREAISFQDYINAPVINGYRGLHTTIILADGTRIRCKIRTREMDEYFHHGIATVCFRPGSDAALAALLPWTKRIASVTEDTKDRSIDFWESLQSDILGEMITVHGSNDEIAQLPKGATALDAAFTFFQEGALRTLSLRLDGKGVLFGSALANGVSLDVAFAEESTVQREWLQWVQTRYAAAMIRGALAENSEEERKQTGKDMLQHIMFERKKGFIEEFSPVAVEEHLAPLGIATLPEAYLAIADGRLQATDVCDAIFPPRKDPKDRPSSSLVQYNMDMHNAEAMDRIIRVHRNHPQEIKEIRYLQEGARQGTARLRVETSPDKRKVLMDELAAAGAKNVTASTHIPAARALSWLFLVLLLWGLDPVFARSLILRDHLTSVDFTLLRFWSLALVFLLVTTLSRRRTVFQPLKLRNPLLWISAALLTLVALTTYAALQQGTATHYETIMTASGLLVATTLHSLSGRKGIALWALFALAAFLLTLSPSWNASSGLFMLGALACFAAFLAVSTRYLRQEHVARRRLDYYTAMLVIGSFCTIPLFVFASPALRDLSTILDTALFSIAFIGLPYYLYYEVSPHQETNDSLIPSAFIMLSATFLGEIALTRHLDIFTFLSYASMIVLSLLLEWRGWPKSLLTLLPSAR